MFKSRIGIKIFASILLILVFSSCSKQKIDEENKLFLKQYGTEVDKINKKREELSKESRSDYYMGEGDNLAGAPNASGAGDRRVTDDMFFIRYNMVNYPNSYVKEPLSFDDINIPHRDAYGVDSDLGEKNYILLDRKALQRGVDNINLSNSMDARENRNKLVKEQKELDRKIKLKKQKGEANSEELEDDDKKDDKKNSESDKQNISIK